MKDLLLNQLRAMQKHLELNYDMHLDGDHTIGSMFEELICAIVETKDDFSDVDREVGQ